MDNVLIVSALPKSSQSITELLKTAGCHKTTCVTSSGEARRLIAQKDFDIIIINSPLSDETGSDLAMMITTKTLAGVILLVKTEISDEVCSKVENYGIIVVEKPINRMLFTQAVKLIDVTRKRMLGFKKENIKLETKISEMRIMDRAKSVLMQYLNMTEPQAHRYIVKHAMDMRMTKAEVAQSILKTYEN